MKLDLSSLKQVKEFAMNFKAKRLPLQLEGRKASLGQPSWVLLEDLPAQLRRQIEAWRVEW